MSGLLDELDDHKDREITLGTGALLAIFFAVVLVCAVFFGLGYSMGRRSGEPAEIAKPRSAASRAGVAASSASVPDSTVVGKPSATPDTAKVLRPLAKPVAAPSTDDSAMSSVPTKMAPAAKGAI